jgi:hypothetical protein
VIAVGARASHVDLRDSDDSRGLLDIKRVQVLGSQRPLWKVFTFGRWTNRQMYESGFIIVFLDTFGDSTFDYYALVRPRNGQMYAELYRDRHPKRDFKVASLSEWRPSQRSVAVRIPLSRMRLGKARITYRWYAETLYTGRRCGRVCFDLAPNRGVVTEPRPDITPTPSPSPSPSAAAH